jgi:hypothetical protein
MKRGRYPSLVTPSLQWVRYFNMKVSIVIKGVDKTVAKLNKVKDVLKNVQPEMEMASKYLLQILSNDVFTSTGQILGELWNPLTQERLRVKARLYPGAGTLQASGKMRGAWRSDVGSTKARLYISDADVPYAKYHQNGGGRLPQRIIAKVTSGMADEVKNIFEKSITSRVRRAV